MQKGFQASWRGPSGKKRIRTFFGELVGAVELVRVFELELIIPILDNSRQL